MFQNFCSHRQYHCLILLSFFSRISRSSSSACIIRSSISFLFMLLKSSLLTSWISLTISLQDSKIKSIWFSSCTTWDQIFHTQTLIKFSLSSFNNALISAIHSIMLNFFQHKKTKSEPRVEKPMWPWFLNFLQQIPKFVGKILFERSYDSFV